MKKWAGIVMHCSDSEFGSVPVIDGWHKARGWSGIGYHFVINNGALAGNLHIGPADGSIEQGRVLDDDPWCSANEEGAHALGLNATHIGVCLIGRNTFTRGQMLKAVELVQTLCAKYGIAARDVLGHYETESGMAQGKTCPNIDMDDFRAMMRLVP